MKNPEKSLLREALDGMAGAGFVRTGMVARAATPELTVLVEFQQSQYGARYFLNVGFWVNAISAPPSKLSIHKCHYYGRAGAEISDALSFDREYEGDRAQRIRSFLLGVLLPELKAVDHAAALTKWVREGKLTSAIVLPDAQRLLGLSK